MGLAGTSPRKSLRLHNALWCQQEIVELPSKRSFFFFTHRWLTASCEHSPTSRCRCIRRCSRLAEKDSCRLHAYALKGLCQVASMRLARFQSGHHKSTNFLRGELKVDVVLSQLLAATALKNHRAHLLPTADLLTASQSPTSAQEWP